MLLAAVSVDLDSIPHYHRIHGLPPLAEGKAAVHAVYDVALGRMESFARKHGFPLTLFAIGADLDREANAAALRGMVHGGHRVENHSFSHRYDLSRAAPEVIRRDIEAAQEAIVRATGRRPVGFRAPGYTVTDTMLDVVEQLGLDFDSSVFPCPAYYGAKALVMGAMWLWGRRSASVLDTSRVLGAPMRPYRPGRPWFVVGERAIWELPIQVTRGLRLPLIGTSIGWGGIEGARWLAKGAVGEPLVNLELHGIDFLDARDGLEHLVRHQPELRIRLEKRLDALSAAIEVIAESGAVFVTLEEACEGLSKAAHFGG